MQAVAASVLLERIPFLRDFRQGLLRRFGLERGTGGDLADHGLGEDLEHGLHQGVRLGLFAKRAVIGLP